MFRPPCLELMEFLIYASSRGILRDGSLQKQNQISLKANLARRIPNFIHFPSRPNHLIMGCGSCLMVTLRLFQLVCAVIIIGIGAWCSSLPLNSRYSIRPNILSQSCTPRTPSAKKATKSSTTSSTAPQKSKYGRNSSTHS